MVVVDSAKSIADDLRGIHVIRAKSSNPALEDVAFLGALCNNHPLSGEHGIGWPQAAVVVTRTSFLDDPEVDFTSIYKMVTSLLSGEAVSKESGIPEGDQRFYNANAPEIPSSMAELLEEYSGIPAGEAQVEHVHRLRDRAYKEYQYPCLGLYRFLSLALSAHPLYHGHVLPLLRGEQDTNDSTGKAPSRIFLDLGTCLGQDIRKLIFDGAPLASLYGADILTEFVNIGYELFADEERLPRSHFVVPADIFDPSSPLKDFGGKVDIIHANSVFHLFNWDDQVTAAKRVAQLLRPEKGSLILGSQVGHHDPGEFSGRPGRRSHTMYRHNEESWERLWQEVGREIGQSFTVKSSLVPHPLTKGNEEAHRGMSRMTFEVWRD